MRSNSIPSSIPYSISLSAFLAFAFVFHFCASQANAFDSAPFVAGPRPKLVGTLAKNYKLRSAQLLGLGKIKGPEDIAVDSKGRIYTGSSFDGKIYRITSGSHGEEKVEVFADPGGEMTLGLAFKNDQLIACNVPKGLLSIDGDGKTTVLSDHCGDKKIFFADDVDIDSNGMIYFSDATCQFPKQNGYRSMFFDLLSGLPHGELFAYDPSRGETRSLLKGLYFANGVALSKEQDYILVNETFRYRVRRFWLKGPKAGTSDLFAENLPGMVDGISTDSDGDYWVSIVAPRSGYMDYVQARPKLKKLFSHLPHPIWGGFPHYGMVLKLNKSGEIVESLQDPTGRVWSVTNAVPWKNFLFVGSLRAGAIAKLELSDLPSTSSALKEPGASSAQ